MFRVQKKVCKENHYKLYHVLNAVNSFLVLEVFQVFEGGFSPPTPLLHFAIRVYMIRMLISCSWKSFIHSFIKIFLLTYFLSHT